MRRIVSVRRLTMFWVPKAAPRTGILERSGMPEVVRSLSLRIETAGTIDSPEPDDRSRGDTLPVSGFARRPSPS
jgi:hypothetical protein